MALDGKTADERRSGVNGLADSDVGTTDWARKAFDSIARTDTNPMVRCAALRGLARSPRSDDVPTLVKIIRSQETKFDDVRPAPAVVRWSAAKNLLAIIDRYLYAESQRKEIVDCLLERLSKDDDRNVRLVVIDALAYFAEAPIPPALVAAMRVDDYSVQHACEKSLISLTGMSHDHDPDAWSAWLASTPDPFSAAGRLAVQEPPPAKDPLWPW